MPLMLLWLAACGQQAPAPVTFHHRTEPTMEAAQTTGSGNGRQVVMPAPVVQPAPEAGGPDIVVQRGDTLYALARQHNLPPRALIDANSLQAPYILQPGQRLRLPSERLHMVQRGETLYAISRAYGVDVFSMASANQLQAPYAIAVGQALRVPGSNGAVAMAAASPVEPAATAPAARQASAFPLSPAPTAPALTGTGVAVQELAPPGAAPPAPPAAAPVVTPAPAAPRATAAQPARPAPLPEVNIPAQPGQAVLPSSQPEAPRPEPEPEPAVAQQVAATPQAPSPTIAPTPVAAPVAPPAVAKPQAEDEPPPRSGRTFAWPVRGRILSTFGPKPDGLHNDGINIAARNGAPVIAAENGVVVYSGSELRGFGNLLLVRHADGWITAYAHLDRVLVQKGQKVTRGQAIATVGSSGAVDQPQLHFEIRRGTQAVDPAKFLTVAMLDLLQPTTTKVMAG